MSHTHDDERTRRVEFDLWQREERAYLIAAGKLRAPQPQQPPREIAQPTPKEPS